jgi:4-hydroxythreonine-4-phosphate dehydrogenase
LRHRPIRDQVRRPQETHTMNARVSPSPIIGLVMGDPAGISPELTARLLADQTAREAAGIVVIGDRRVLAAGEVIAGVSLEIPVIESFRTPEPGETLFLDLGHCDPATIRRGEASAEGGAFAMTNFRTGLELARDRKIDVVFFTPFNKQALKLAGNPYLDEIHFAADVLGHKGPCSEFNILGDLWNARVTSHIPLKDVAKHITKQAVVDALVLTDAGLKAAGVAAPRIALAALNPHAGDGGNFGTEEIEILEPAVAEARKRQIRVDGPFPSDTVFLRAKAGHFDAVQTLYHDQGQIAIKMMGFEKGVTVLGGMTVPIVTPAHGTAYDIAGTGTANVSATREAFRIACEMGLRHLAA